MLELVAGHLCAVAVEKSCSGCWWLPRSIEATKSANSFPPVTHAIVHDGPRSQRDTVWNDITAAEPPRRAYGDGARRGLRDQSGGWPANIANVDERRNAGSPASSTPRH